MYSVGVIIVDWFVVVLFIGLYELGVVVVGNLGFVVGFVVVFNFFCMLILWCLVVMSCNSMSVIDWCGINVVGFGLILMFMFVIVEMRDFKIFLKFLFIF